MFGKGTVSFRGVWSLFMTFAYVGIAYLVVFTPMLLRYNAYNDPSMRDENATLRIILGIIFLIYGIMRGYSCWIRYKADK